MMKIECGCRTVGETTQAVTGSTDTSLKLDSRRGSASEAWREVADLRLLGDVLRPPTLVGDAKAHR